MYNFRRIGEKDLLAIFWCLSFNQLLMHSLNSNTCRRVEEHNIIRNYDKLLHQGEECQMIWICGESKKNLGKHYIAIEN